MMATCLVCDGQLGPSKLPGLLQCHACQFVTADVSMSQQELARLYSASYFAGEEYMNYLADRPVIEKQFRGRLKKVLAYAPYTESKTLLEVGSAYGFFLAMAQSHFRSVQGIDISEDAAEYARTRMGLPVYTGDFLAHDISEKIDVLCMWDTIEHLQHPHLYLDKAAQNMPPGGVIAITTGDIGSVVARLRGAKWRQIHPPTHLHYFSKATLARLLRKHGFTVRYSAYEGIYRSIDTMAYILLNIKRKQPGLYQKMKQLGLLNGFLYLNLYDIVLCIATRD